MNLILEQKLKDLVEEAKQAGAPAVHTVLNLLLAAHDNHNHHKFAKYCCEFSSLGTIAVTAQAPGQAAKQTKSEFGGDCWGDDWTKSSH